MYGSLLYLRSLNMFLRDERNNKNNLKKILINEVAIFKNVGCANYAYYFGRKVILFSACGASYKIDRPRNIMYFYKFHPETPDSEVINLFSCSIEREILTAHEYKTIKKFGFLCSDKSRMLSFPLINVKMPTIVGISTFLSRNNFMLS